MAFDYAKAQLLAQRVIHANGRTFKFVKRSRTPADVNKPWEGTEVTTVTEEVRVLVVPSGQIQGAMGVRSMFRDEEVLHKLNAFVSPLDLLEDIENYDFVQDLNLVYSIDQVRTLHPGAVRIVHEILLDTVK